ncbi:MAG: hypothetical protein NVSMB27_50130 [Ktedonobacteraceae bacterium]
MKEQMVRALAEAHGRLLTATARAVTRGAISAKCWGPREILTHIAAWEAEASHRIPLLAANAPDQTYDTDAFNTAAIASIGDQSFEQIERIFQQTHQHLADLLEAQEEQAFASGGYAQEGCVAKTMTKARWAWRGPFVQLCCHSKQLGNQHNLASHISFAHALQLPFPYHIPTGCAMRSLII